MDCIVLGVAKSQTRLSDFNFFSEYLLKIKKLGSPRRERSGIFKEEERTNFFNFFLLHSLGLYNNNVSCLRTVFGLNPLANSVILKHKFWE